MSQRDDPAEGEAHGVAEINHRGRLTIPKTLRNEMHLKAGETFTVVREGSDIRLIRQLPELQILSSGRSREEWADVDAFRDVGDATFGGR